MKVFRFLLFFVFFFLFISQTYARQYTANTAPWHCQIAYDFFGATTDDFYGARFWVFKDQFPVADIKLAAQHLVRYCCEKNLIADTGAGTKCPPKDSKGQLPDDLMYPEFDDIFNQLVDIWFRRLAGSSDEQYTEASLDDQAVERREKITAFATALYGALPGLVVEVYGTYRKIDSQDFPPVLDDGDLEKIQKDREDYWLKNKYLATCFLAKKIAGEFLSDGAAPYEPTEKVYNRCLGLANKIIGQEADYMQYVIIKQGAALLTYNTKSYADWYFVRWKLQPLLEKIAKMQTTFATVNQKINEGTKQCSM